ncbi:efflux RND transporter permease subunit, partial [Gluconobacter kanchanaburiensis]|uniref:efflux RND transporter permease subunit n=1 Tax=Gluconobacter kanchanaburiensis TaxID=563199 RepID=UPI001884C3FF
VLVAMVMTPALCASMLKPTHKGSDRGPAAWFNRTFDRLTNGYIGGVKWLIRVPVVSMIGFVLLTALVGFLFTRIPTGFLPDEDQGLIFGQVTMRPGATDAQTAAVNRRIADYILKTYGKTVSSVLSMNGFNFAGQGQNAGAFFIRMKPWDERPGRKNSTAVIAGEIMKHFQSDPEAQIFAVNPPAVLELGNATGFDLELEDTGHLGHDALLAARNQILREAAKNP